MSISRVSIIIPAWNAERYVKEAVDSALAQTYPHCEVVVIDDGSTDNTRTVLEPYVKRKRIRYIHQENRGLAGARNAGVRAAAGKYIAFLDSDDAFLPEKIAKQVGVLEAHPEYGLCYSDILHFSDPPSDSAQGKRVFYHHRYTYPSGNILEPLLHRQFLNPLGVVVRKEVFERHGYFDETLRRSEDWDLWLKWAHAGVQFLYLDEPLAHYRIRTVGNLSDVASEPEMKEKNYEIFSRFGKNLTREEWLRYGFEDILHNLKTKVVLAHLMVGNKAQALTHAEHFSAPARFLILITPAFLWRLLLTRFRVVKHRLLLRKMP